MRNTHPAVPATRARVACTGPSAGTRAATAKPTSSAEAVSQTKYKSKAQGNRQASHQASHNKSNLPTKTLAVLPARTSVRRGGEGGGPSQTKPIFFFRFFSRSTMYQTHLWHTLNCTQCSGTGIQWRRKRRQDVQGDTISVYIGTPETCKTCKGKGTKPCKTPRQTKTKPQS